MLTPEQAALLADGSTLFDSESAFVLWLFREHPLLPRDESPGGTVSPAEAVLAGRTDEVSALIDQLASGAFV